MPRKYKSCLRKVRASTKKRYGYRKYNEYAICSKLRYKPRYKLYKYKNKKSADIKAKKHKKMYGYKPTVFKATSPKGVVRYVVVKPYGLRKIK